MTRAEIAEKVAKDTGFSVEECDILILSLIKVLRKHILLGTTIDIRGLGVFKRKFRKEKKAYDITHKKHILIKARSIPYFKFAKDLEREVINDTEEEDY